MPLRIHPALAAEVPSFCSKSFFWFSEVYSLSKLLLLAGSPQKDRLCPGANLGYTNCGNAIALENRRKGKRDGGE
jgi:hypothetical protein